MLTTTKHISIFHVSKSAQKHQKFPKRAKNQGPNMKLKVLELFSGIGGMHFALKQASKVLKNEEKALDFEIVAAMDINEVANQGLLHRFFEIL